jgi:hypothetical protein
MSFTIVSSQGFGVQAGPTFSSMKQDVSLEEMYSMNMDYNTKTMFYGGIYGNFTVGNILALQPEINYIQKGGKYDNLGFKYDAVINYIEVPVYLLYNGGKTQGFFGGLGPSFNFGLSGKYKMDGEEEKIAFGKDKDLQAFHAAINLQAGYQFGNGFQVNAFFSQSLTNSQTENQIMDEEFEGTATSKFNFTNYGLRVGYRFNPNKGISKKGLKTVL